MGEEEPCIFGWGGIGGGMSVPLERPADLNERRISRFKLSMWPVVRAASLFLSSLSSYLKKRNPKYSIQGYHVPKLKLKE